MITSTPLQHLLDMPEDLGAYEPLVERAPLSHLVRPLRNDEEGVLARAKTTATLFQHGLEATMDEEEETAAVQQFNNFTNQVPINQAALNRPGIVLKLAALLSEYDHQITRDAAQLRTYVTNRLIEESDPTMPASQRMRALNLLGQITEVGLFTERTEITVKTMSMENLEAKLHDRLITLLPEEYRITDVTPEEAHAA